MEPHKTKTLLHSEGKKKRQPTEWDNIFAKDIFEKGLISKICKKKFIQKI